MKRIATSTLALLLGGAIVLYYLVMRKKQADLVAAEIAAAAIAKQKASAASVGTKPLPQPPGFDTTITSIDTSGNDAAAATALQVVSYVPVLGQIAKVGAYVNTKIANAIWGNGLGVVRYSLLARRLAPPPDQTRNGDGKIYALDTNGILHHIEINVNDAGFSWREVITVDANVFDSFMVGSPVTTPGKAESHGFTPLGRPIGKGAPAPNLVGEQKASQQEWQGIIDVFGRNSIWQGGNDTKVYGPWGLDPSVGIVTNPQGMSDAYQQDPYNAPGYVFTGFVNGALPTHAQTPEEIAARDAQIAANAASEAAIYSQGPDAVYVAIILQRYVNGRPSLAARALPEEVKTGLLAAQSRGAVIPPELQARL